MFQSRQQQQQKLSKCTLNEMPKIRCINLKEFELIELNMNRYGRNDDSMNNLTQIKIIQKIVKFHFWKRFTYPCKNDEKYNYYDPGIGSSIHKMIIHFE